jgi:hypothetical protein
MQSIILQVLENNYEHKNPTTTNIPGKKTKASRILFNMLLTLKSKLEQDVMVAPIG